MMDRNLIVLCWFFGRCLEMVDCSGFSEVIVLLVRLLSSFVSVWVSVSVFVVLIG